MGAVWDFAIWGGSAILVGWGATWGARIVNFPPRGFTRGFWPVTLGFLIYPCGGWIGVWPGGRANSSLICTFHVVLEIYKVSLDCIYPALYQHTQFDFLFHAQKLVGLLKSWGLHNCNASAQDKTLQTYECSHHHSFHRYNSNMGHCLGVEFVQLGFKKQLRNAESSPCRKRLSCAVLSFTSY